jgi:hypothetical protein
VMKRLPHAGPDISVLFPDNVGTKDFAHEKATKAPEGTATGAVQAQELLLEARSAGWLESAHWRFPGVGPLIAAGPIRGGADRGRRWRHAGRHHRSPGRHGHSRI